MEINLASFLPNLFAFLSFTFLVAFFIYQSKVQNRPVAYVLTSMILGAITTFLILLWSTFENTDSKLAWMVRHGYLIVSGIQFIYFYLFIENSNTLKPSRGHLVGLFMLFGLEVFGFLSYSLFYVPGSSEHFEILQFFKLIGRIGYNGLAIYVFALVSFPIYYRMYRYTNEKRSLILLIGISLIGLGYSLTFIFDILYIYKPELFGVGNFYNIMLSLGNNVPMIGLVTIAILYAFNLSYIYRLPFDHYVLLVTYKSGLNILSVEFQTKYKNISIKEQLISGMLSAVNNIYKYVFDSHQLIDAINSKDLSIVMENGEYVSVIMVTQHPSGILKRGMRLFVKKFEATFHEALERTEQEIQFFENGRQIFTRIFPFLNCNSTNKKKCPHSHIIA